MKILSTEQVRKADAYTITNEPILSINLMERAAAACTKWLTNRFHASTHFKVFVGPGNNGGDGLAIARMLDWEGFSVHVFLIADKLSHDSAVNLERLDKQSLVSINKLRPNSRLPEIMPTDVVIDALFGSGLSRPLDGNTARVVKHINKSNSQVVSIDIPSGLFAENTSQVSEDQVIIHARHTLKLQTPSLGLFLRESSYFFGEWHILPIGLHEGFINKTNTSYNCSTQGEVAELLPERAVFSHKGDYGHGLLIAGSKGKVGAAFLAAKATLRAGAGLLTVHLPDGLERFFYGSFPEAMVSLDPSNESFTRMPELESYSALAIGPGLGKSVETTGALYQLLETLGDKPCVFDADALNIMAANRDLLDDLPPSAVLTPHPKEFSRLTGETYANSFERLQAARGFAKEREVVLVLKGAYSAVISPQGEVYFNTTGNPGMATAGSGDVLTGVILGLLSQGLEPLDAARLGVFLHGLAGDLAEESKGQEAMIASDITSCLPDAFNEVKNQKYINSIPEN